MATGDVVGGGWQNRGEAVASNSAEIASQAMWQRGRDREMALTLAVHATKTVTPGSDIVRMATAFEAYLRGDAP